MRLPLPVLIGTVVAVAAGAGNAPTLVNHPITSASRPVYLDGADWTVVHLPTSTNGTSYSLQVAATVPGDILTDLQRAGAIPDPYWNTSWRDPSFIASWNEGSWRYSKSFPTPTTVSNLRPPPLFDRDGHIREAEYIWMTSGLVGITRGAVYVPREELCV